MRPSPTATLRSSGSPAAVVTLVQPKSMRTRTMPLSFFRHSRLSKMVPWGSFRTNGVDISKPSRMTTPAGSTTSYDPSSSSSSGVVSGSGSGAGSEARKVLGWPKRRKLAHAILWEYGYKRLKLARLLGQLGAFLTCVRLRLRLDCCGLG